MNGTQTQAAPAQKQVTAPIPELKLDEDKLTALAAGKVLSYTPLGEQTPIKLSLGMIQQYCAIPTKNGHLPTPADCIRFGMLVMTRRLNPFTGDCYFVGYDSQDGPSFSMIVGVQALLKRAEIHPQFDGLESGVVVKTKDGQVVEYQGDLVMPGDTLLGGWAKVYRKDRQRPIYQRLQLSTFKKNNKFWNGDPAGQISKTAEAHSLRQAFPSDVGGLYLQAEIEAFTDHAAHMADRRKFDFEGTKPGPVDLDTLTKHAPEAQVRPEKAGNGSPAQSSEPPAGPAAQSGSSGPETTAEASGDAAIGSETAPETPEAGSGSQNAQVQNGDESGQPTAADDPDSKIETWQADIDVAGTNGRLDQIADLAKQHAPDSIRGKVMEMIGEKRLKLKKK